MAIEGLSTPLAMVSRWWRQWPAWWPSAAMAWSVAYGTLALGWALGAPGFPFGEHDPEGAAMGSVLFAARAEPTGLVMAGCCLVGAIVAIAMRRPTGHRRRRGLLLAVAWCFAVTMILVVPDIRLLQNLAYALMLVFVKLDWRVLHQGVIVLGGALWAMTAMGYRRRNAGVGADRGEAEVAADRTRTLVRWGRAATYVAVLGPLPYGITRLAWALGGGIVTLGLIRPWGEIWPRWVPFLAGRRVPVALPTILGGLAALAITAGAFSFVRLVLIDALGWQAEPAEPATITGWGTWAPGWLWPFWGIALGIATIAYYHRRRDPHRQGRGLRPGSPR